MSSELPPRGGAGEDLRADLRAAVAARRELGPAYEDELVGSFLDRVDRELDARIDARMAGARSSKGEQKADREHRTYGFVLGLVSLGTGIPLTAIAAAQTDLPGVVVTWLGIVGVNAAHALRSPDRRRPTSRGP